MTTLTTAIDNEEETEEGGEKGVLSPKKSLRGAINLYCRDCIYDEHAKGEGNWRQQVEACTVNKCALYEVRPISKPKKVTDLLSEE